MLDAWVAYALLAMFITGIEMINLKYLQLLSNDLNISLALCFVFTGLVSFFYIIYKKNKFTEKITEYKYILSIILFVILLLVSRFAFLKSIELAPSIGYTHMIINLNVLITLALSYFLFKQNINIKVFAGIVLALLGLFIIIKYSKMK